MKLVNTDAYNALLALVEDQQESKQLWSHADTATEDNLQRALGELHRAVEALRER